MRMPLKTRKDVQSGAAMTYICSVADWLSIFGTAALFACVCERRGDNSQCSHSFSTKILGNRSSQWRSRAYSR